MTSHFALKQSFAWWCFANRGVEPDVLIGEAARIGYLGVDLVDEKYWAQIADHGMKISAINGHASIADGLNNPANADRIENELLAKIEKAQKWGIPALICFSGNVLESGSGIATSAKTLARVAPVAEQAGVTLVLEMLNSKVDHTGYEADHTAWAAQLCERVGSPAVKMLYDIYHMQIMEGDLIRTIRDHQHQIGHYHTAGNPGRCPMDDLQEINYPAVYHAIRDTGYTGFIGHEFSPRENPLQELATAFRQCAGNFSGME